MPKTQQPKNLLVFIIRKGSKCGECSEELWPGSFITLDQEKGALCLSCADLDRLVYLPSYSPCKPTFAINTRITTNCCSRAASAMRRGPSFAVKSRTCWRRGDD